MFRISASFALAIVTASVFASNAEARGGSWYAQPFFRNQGRPQPSQEHYAPRQDFIAIERARAREFAEQRAEAAEAKRARLLALERREAAKIAAAKAAAQQAQQAADANAPDTTTVAKTGNLLPAATTAAPTDSQKSSSGKTDTAGATPDPASVTTASTPETCRKYSAAADAVIEVPCR